MFELCTRYALYLNTFSAYDIGWMLTAVFCVWDGYGSIVSSIARRKILIEIQLESTDLIINLYVIYFVKQYGPIRIDNKIFFNDKVWGFGNVCINVI